MKTILKLSLIAAAIGVTGCANNTSIASKDAARITSASAIPGIITVEIDGFKVQDGQVSVALFDEAGYRGGAPIRGKNADVKGESVTIKFEGLPVGEYGIKMYQDVDRSGQMNANAFGLPTEPYAFSNNAVGMMGPAKWDAAKFKLTQAGAIQQISFP